ncbi:MAG: hypothetical protein K9J17_04640 [Flavobacteriales bacterium]|nr:hypothetical protein [Flavobacteriales bacterium]
MFYEVDLGPYEEKLRVQLFDGSFSGDEEIEITVLSWRNDPSVATDIVGQPRKHRKDGKTSYSFMLDGFIVMFGISEKSAPAMFKPFRLKDDGTLSIVHLPKGYVNEFLVNYSGASEILRKTFGSNTQ